MPIIDSSLENAIKNIINTVSLYDGKSEGQKQADAVNYISEQLATAIDNQTKTATVTVNAGIPVSTAGTATAQTGETTAEGTGGLS